MKVIYFFLIGIFLFSCGTNNQKENEEIIFLNPNFYIAKNPKEETIQSTNFNFELIYPGSKRLYFVHYDRTGIWTPEQFAIQLEIQNQNVDTIFSYYEKVLKNKGWQILQTSKIEDKKKKKQFINAQDIFNRNVSILMEEENQKTIIRMYLKKVSDE